MQDDLFRSISKFYEFSCPDNNIPCFHIYAVFWPWLGICFSIKKYMIFYRKVFFKEAPERNSKFLEITNMQYFHNL